MNQRQLLHTDMKRFGDEAFSAYAQRLWSDLSHNIKAADSVQNFKTQQNTLLFRGQFIDFMIYKHLYTDYLLWRVLESVKRVLYKTLILTNIVIIYIIITIITIFILSLLLPLLFNYHYSSQTSQIQPQNIRIHKYDNF